MLFRETVGPDFVLGHMERDWFPQNGQWKIGKLHNKYYHLKKNCILQRCSLYQFPNDFLTLKLDSAITSITPSVKNTLSCEFGLNIM